MILNFDEVNPAFGNTPVNDGVYWRSKPAYLFSAITNVSLTAAAAASIYSTVGAQGSPILPPGLLNVPGRTLFVNFCGYATTAGSSEGNATFALKLGSNVIATSAAVALAASQTTIGFWGQVLITCKASNVAGGTGALDTFGQVALGPLATSVPNVSIVNGTTVGTIAPATQVAIDQTLSYLLDVRLTLSATGNTFVFTNLTFESAF